MHGTITRLIMSQPVFAAPEKPPKPTRLPHLGESIMAIIGTIGILFVILALAVSLGWEHKN